MTTLQKIPRELHDEITNSHVIVGASIVEEGDNSQSLVKSMRENLFETTIHVLQKNTDGSIHNEAIYRASLEVLYDFIDDVNALEHAIQKDLEQIPDIAGVFFTKPRALATIFD